jgi:hypothetical protein
MYIIFVECPHELRWRVAGGPDPKEVNRATEGGCPGSPAVKCMDMVYILSPDIVYTLCHPVKRRRALLESNLTKE